MKKEIKLDAISLYRKKVTGKYISIIFLTVLVLIFFILAICIGSSFLSIKDVIFGLLKIGDANNILIIYNIRIPKALAAVIAGGGLAISGCIMQNVLKNPMASPSTLGVGNAAAFGANVAIISFGFGSSLTNDTFLTSSPYVVSLFSFAFSILSIGLILLLAKFKKFSNSSIILAGVAISTIFQAGTTLIQYFATDTELANAVYWMFGDLSRATYIEILIMTIVIVVSLIYFLFKRWEYNAITSGYDIANSLGVKVEKTTIVSLLLASLITSICVAFLGIIGFVGLIAPQIMKRIIGEDFRFLIPTSFLFGSCLLLVSYLFGTLIFSGSNLPVGAITSLLGGPMFIYLLLRGKDA